MNYLTVPDRNFGVTDRPLTRLAEY